MNRAITIARDLVNAHDVTVPVDLETLIKKLGISLNFSPLESMSGFAYQKDGQRVIGINEDEGKQRKRFTIAHELGHMLVHASSDVLFDKKDDFVYFRDDNSSTGLQPREIEANAFAAELLMPYEVLLDRIAQLGGVDLIADDDKVKHLAEEFDVSFTAMSVRIDSLARHGYSAAKKLVES